MWPLVWQTRWGWMPHYGAADLAITFFSSAFRLSAIRRCAASSATAASRSAVAAAIASFASACSEVAAPTGDCCSLRIASSSAAIAVPTVVHGDVLIVGKEYCVVVPAGHVLLASRRTLVAWRLRLRRCCVSDIGAGTSQSSHLTKH